LTPLEQPAVLPPGRRHIAAHAARVPNFRQARWTDSILMTSAAETPPNECVADGARPERRQVDDPDSVQRQGRRGRSGDFGWLPMDLVIGNYSAPARHGSAWVAPPTSTTAAVADGNPAGFGVNTFRARARIPCRGSWRRCQVARSATGTTHQARRSRRPSGLRSHGPIRSRDPVAIGPTAQLETAAPCSRRARGH